MARKTVLILAAMSLLAPGASMAGNLKGAAISPAAQAQSRAERQPIQRICKVSYDPTPNEGPPRERLASAECPVNAPLNKGDACFCVVTVDGQPYAAAGKVAFVLPGGGYSW